MRVEREIIRLRGIAVEKPRQGLPGVHYFEVSGVVNEFLVFVRGRGSGRNKLVFQPAELLKESLIGFRPVSPEDGCFVERGGREISRVNVSVADPFIVCYQNSVRRRLRFVERPNIGDVDSKDSFPVADKLMPHFKRRDDESFPAFPL